MDLQTRKLSFIQEFLKIQNEDIISALENILQKKKLETYENKQKPMSIDQFNDEIDQALEDSKNGYLIKASDLKNNKK